MQDPERGTKEQEAPDRSAPAVGTRIASLRSRSSPLASPVTQLGMLERVDLASCPHGGSFPAALADAGHAALRPAEIEIFQINMGRLCNMTCRHCHVDAGPDRTDAVMAQATVDACLAALDRTAAHTVDLTGGAPELNRNFRHVVEHAVGRGKHVMDRCNLTVLLTPSHRDLPEWLADRGVEMVCSLPHFRKRGTDAQRGGGTFERSVEALRRLNRVGYGKGDPRRRLTLVANPVGAFLSAGQASLEREWRQELERSHGATFDRLIVINNMPIARYLEWLEASGNLRSYMEVLVHAFNPAVVDGLMCRNTLSVSWDGRVFHCDFNQMLDLEVRDGEGRSVLIHDFDPDAWARGEVVVGRHCFGCAAGAGSSCGGEITP